MGFSEKENGPEGGFGSLLGSAAGAGADAAQNRGAPNYGPSLLALKLGFAVALPFLLRLIVVFITTTLGLYCSHVLLLESWGLLPSYIDFAMPLYFEPNIFLSIIYIFKLITGNPFLWVSSFIAIISMRYGGAYISQSPLRFFLNVFSLIKKQWFLGTNIIVGLVALASYLATNMKVLSLWVSFKVIESLPASVAQNSIIQAIPHANHDFYHDSVFGYAVVVFALTVIYSIIYLLVRTFADIEPSIYSFSGTGNFVKKVLGFNGVEF
jgi:hypothetical protein